MNKLKFLLRSFQQIKNWYIIPFVYLGLFKKKYFVLYFKNGLKCKMRTKSTDLQAFANVWLTKEYESIGFQINDISMIDVGAHIGLFALYASQFCKKGKIFCFEPVKENFNLLQENLILNNINNVEIYNKAVSGKDKKIKIFLDENDFAAHSMFGEKKKFQEIDSVLIKTIIEENHLERCNIKLDCEGAEYEILQSIPENYFNKIENICLEYHIIEKNPDDLKNLKKKLESHYKINQIKTSQDLGIILAQKK